MKRHAHILLAVLLVLALTCPALAASTLYPADIVEYTEGDHIRLNKVYNLTGEDDPAAIPTADFEQEGLVYTLLDLTRQDMGQTETKSHTETVTVKSKSNSKDKIMSLLPATQEVTTEDGFAGVLTLDTDSIKTEAASYGTSSKAVTATRSYPNLSDADVSLIPKTTEDSGRTLELSDVRWQEAGGYYHATATYSGTATSRYATGYTVTAKYTGEVSRVTSDTVVYTAIFSGTPLSLSGEVKTPGQSGAVSSIPSVGGWNWLYLIPTGILVAGAAIVIIFGGKKLKGKKWEE